MGTGLWCITEWLEHGLGLRCSELVRSVGGGDGHGSWIQVEAELVVTPTISRVELVTLEDVNMVGKDCGCRWEHSCGHRGTSGVSRCHSYCKR